jgi:hypothetical protein
MGRAILNPLSQGTEVEKPNDVGLLGRWPVVTYSWFERGWMDGDAKMQSILIQVVDIGCHSGRDGGGGPSWKPSTGRPLAGHPLRGCHWLCARLVLPHFPVPASKSAHRYRPRHHNRSQPRSTQSLQH